MDPLQTPKLPRELGQLRGSHTKLEADPWLVSKNAAW